MVVDPDRFAFNPVPVAPMRDRGEVGRAIFPWRACDRLSRRANSMIKIILAAMVFAVAAALPAGAAESDWSPVEDALGAAGTLQPGGVFKVVFPRSDLSVVVDEVPIKPALALTTWIGFMKAGQDTMVMGDLVLTDKEVGRVTQNLVAAGISITALHNHLLRTNPAIMYMHVEAKGDPVMIARKLRGALAATGTPIPAPTAAGDGPFDAAALDQAMGRTGRPGPGVLSYSIPRQTPVSEDGIEIPPAMGTATAINFETLGDETVASTGDFVLAASEIDPVMQTLAAHGIEVTALHSHMRNESPRLFFMHFWGVGKTAEMGAGLRAALDRMDVAPKP